MRHLLFLTLLTLLSGSLPAQRRIIVDSANGPGTDYLDVDQAVRWSQPGDVIIVRPGTGRAYNLNRDIMHGIRIVAPGSVTPALSCNNYVDIPAGQLFVIDNIALGGPRPPYSLFPGSCQGTFIISRCTGIMRHAVGCPRAIYTDCNIYPGIGTALIIDDATTAYALDCDFSVQYTGQPSPIWVAGGVSVTDNSRIWVVNSRVKGGDWTTQSLQGDIGLNIDWSCRGFVAGRSTFTGGRSAGLFPHATGLWVTQGTIRFPGGFVVLDPLTQSIEPRQTHGLEYVVEMPAVSTSDAVQGQPQTLDVIGPTNSVVAVFTSLYNGRAPIETSFGDFWLEGLPILLGAGAVDANRDLQIGITIPQWLPQGEVLAYQAISLSPQSMFQLSPPAFAVVQ